jgi:hypothetical protein
MYIYTENGINGKQHLLLIAENRKQKLFSLVGKQLIVIAVWCQQTCPFMKQIIQLCRHHLRFLTRRRTALLHLFRKTAKYRTFSETVAKERSYGWLDATRQGFLIKQLRSVTSNSKTDQNCSCSAKRFISFASFFSLNKQNETFCEKAK